MILFLFIVLAIGLILERISLRLPVDRLHYELKPSSACVEPGEEFRLVTTLENKTGRSIPYLRMEEEIPREIELTDAASLEIMPRRGMAVHSGAVFIRKNQRLRRSVRARACRRGIHYLRRAELYFGDFLGLSEKSRTALQTHAVLVYPLRLENDRLRQMLSDILGEVSARSFLFEDPMLVAGYRDYTGREPLRAISFPQSARCGRLIVKEFDHTKEELLNIIFDLSYKGNFDHYYSQQEAAFSIVRTLCECFERRGLRYRLITNLSAGEQPVSILHGGTGGGSFARLLEILGRSSGTAACRAEELLHTAFQHCPAEGEFLYVAHRRDGEAETFLAGRRGRKSSGLRCFYGEDYESEYLDRMREIQGNSDGFPAGPGASQASGFSSEAKFPACPESSEAAVYTAEEGLRRKSGNTVNIGKSGIPGFDGGKEQAP